MYIKAPAVKVKSSTSLVLCVFYSEFCIKFNALTLDIFIDTAIIQQICHYQTYTVPLLQVIKYHSYQRYQYRLLGPAEKAEQPTNSEQYLNAFVKNCWCCYDINTV